MDTLEKEPSIVCSFYRHSDGYPEGHGQDLAKWLSGKRLVNGIGSDFLKGRDFNRAGTMAVKLMDHIQEVSGCEVIPTGKGDMWEDYVYNVYFRDGEFFVETVYAHDKSSAVMKAREYDWEKVEEQLETVS